MNNDPQWWDLEIKIECIWMVENVSGSKMSINEQMANKYCQIIVVRHI